MNNLTIFENNEFGEIRVADIGNKPYFMLSDVCRVLEIKNSRDTKSRLNKNGVGTTDIIDSMGRMQQADFINESNLYKLVFQSRKPQAEKFSEWVTSEVLPSIRKHGAYMTDDVLEKTIENPDFLIGILDNLKKEKQKRQELELEKEENRPKVLFAESVQSSNKSILIGEMAKLIKQNGINIGQNRLFEWLRNNGYLISRKGESYNLPTQKSMELKILEIKESTHLNPDGSVRLTRTPKVTGKGQIYFINKFKGGILINENV